jgi:hypothetical protein
MHSSKNKKKKRFFDEGFFLTYKPEIKSSILTNKDKIATAQNENLVSTSPQLSPLKLPSSFCKPTTNSTNFSALISPTTS